MKSGIIKSCLSLHENSCCLSNTKRNPGHILINSGKGGGSSSQSRCWKLCHEVMKPWETHSRFLIRHPKTFCSVLVKHHKNKTLCPRDLSLQHLGVSLHRGMESVSSARSFGCLWFAKSGSMSHVNAKLTYLISLINRFCKFI